MIEKVSLKRESDLNFLYNTIRQMRATCTSLLLLFESYPQLENDEQLFEFDNDLPE